MVPSFAVPAEYFYALHAQLPLQVSAETRYRMATLEDPRRNREQLEQAIEAGIILGSLAINPAQAARRLEALGKTRGSPDALLPEPSAQFSLVEAWLAVTDTDVESFWTTTVPASHAAGHLDLVLSAIIEEDPAPLSTAAAPYFSGLVPALPFGSVVDLQGVTASQWRDFFVIPAHAGLLPGFTQPGSFDERIRAFVRRLRQYFVVPAGVSDFTVADGPTQPTWGAPNGGALEALIAAYAAVPPNDPFSLLAPVDDERLRIAVEALFPGNPRAQRWLSESARALNHLALVTAGLGTDGYRFSLMEALYARGFSSMESIAGPARSDFQDALTGTVAYPHATSIHEAAGGSEGPGGGSPGERRPVNANGELVNCIPPEHCSPLGPVAYLHELLTLTPASTCSNPFPEGDTLAAWLSERRGPLGDLQATHENLEVALPLVDLANESLEAMVATGDAAGAVYQTTRAALLEVFPEHSSPAVPVAQPAAYDALRAEATSPLLPYSQPLDVVRTYLETLGTSRYAVMRRFRKEITEFVLDPSLSSPHFRSHLWRYPVRLELAREYLGIAPEEASLFESALASDTVAQLYGFASGTAAGWPGGALRVPTFLERTGLRYCELRALVEARWFELELGPGEATVESLPECEPCCLREWTLVIGDSSPEAQREGLRRLASSVRLWRKLQQLPGAHYSFEALADLAQVFEWFPGDGQTNSEFVRQLAAFQLLRDELHLGLVDPREPSPEPGASGAGRTHLLGLWVPGARKRPWAIEQWLEHIGDSARACSRHREGHAGFFKLLEENLGPLSRLVGFDPLDTAVTWDAHPTHTLRFTEVLTKLYASSFGIGELSFLFTVEDHLAGADPLPLASRNETLESPLDLPDDDETFSLWALRRRLLDVELCDEQVACWSWPRIVHSLEDEFGYPGGLSPDTLQELGAHFFPSIAGKHGYLPTDEQGPQYRVALTSTSESMWNTPPGGPFRYDPDTNDGELSTELPLTDEAVLDKLGRIRQLGPDERSAVQHLYFAPRVTLARFAFLFPDFIEADERLIQEPDEIKRWLYFQRAFALTHARSRLIAEHVAAHVGAVTRTPRDRCRDGHGASHGDDGAADLAWKLLKHLLADENAAVAPANWENDNGEAPDVTWKPSPSGGAFAALLGLVGTGVLGDVRPMQEDGELVFRELRGPLCAFGAVRNGRNAPLPTLVPALDADGSTSFVTVRNGLGLQNENARHLGGAEGFCVTWRGVLLVEASGGYVFRAGSPTPDGEEPGTEGAEHQRWQVALKRGQKAWQVISHEGPSDKASNLTAHHPLMLKRGAYDLEVEFRQCPPDFDRKHPERAQTGFQLKYSGPDTCDELVAVPSERLYVAFKDMSLADSVADAESSQVKEFLALFYRSTLRDVRRTYQRAFKALLFAHRLKLSAKPLADSGQSEIEYCLSHPEDFEGLSFYQPGGGYLPHRAWLNLNFLPVGDPYFAPSAARDSRAAPSSRRTQAMFDWWERLFDYTVMREATRHAPEAPAWLLFHEAAEQHEDNPAHLLRHIGIELSRAELVLRFYDGFEVDSEHLRDERWATRAWRGDRWLEQLLDEFFAKDVRAARPELWASDDPAVEHSGVSGNANLVQFVQDGSLDNGDPVRTEALKRLNDGLRLRARAALVAYLTTPAHQRVDLPWGGFARTAKELGERLLLDVEAGLCQRASRIEEAVTAVQGFVARARLGLEPEPAFEPSIDFALLWDRRFADLRTWQACTRRRLYRENVIEWEELDRARRSESFRFFENRLRRMTLTVAAPAGLVSWTGEQAPQHPGIALSQAREPSVLAALPAPSPGYEHGLTALGVPDRHARPSWLAAPPLAEGVGMANKLPSWLEAAVRLGTEFLRVAAAGQPMGSAVHERPLGDAAGCCIECGAIHPPSVDEYYFWLLDTRHFEGQGQDAEVDIELPGVPLEQEGGSAWRNPEKLPKLLAWQSLPKVHLAWARLHNGELKQMRRSARGVRLELGVAPKLELVGRSADSLLFHVVGALTAPDGHVPGHEDEPDPGFRYALATDCAEVVPPVVPPSEAPATFVLGLPAYPYFLFFTPGAPLVSPSFFSQATTAAGVLRAHCRFEAALKWYERYFTPLSDDAAWCPDPGDAGCCIGAEPDAPTARRRAIVLHYLETLLEWGDARLRRNSPEALEHARVLFTTANRILGERPRTVRARAETAEPSAVGVFEPMGAALNPRLLAVYERVNERLALIHDCSSAERLPRGTSSMDLEYFGDVMVKHGWQTSPQPCRAEASWGVLACPYRFVFMVQRALELTREVQALGGLLLSAYEKGDAEYLASLRQSHERQLLELALDVRKHQWRDADWQVQALQKTKEIAQTRRRYFRTLIDFGLISKEEAYRQLTLSGLDARTAGNVMMAIGQFMHLIPDVYVGQNNFTHLPVGSKLAALFSAIATICNTVGDIMTTHAGLSLTEAGWQRREDEWIHQVEVLDLEIEQVERQILGAERRRDAALQELNNHQRQLEQSVEVLDFLRDKFTAHELYLWLQRETAALYRTMYELAHQTAQQAQRAFNFELGHLAEDFVGGEHWDDLHEGLLAGERLLARLRRMEKAYTDKNHREYELTKQLSLRELFPLALLELRLTGRCELELPEWLFDLDYPGHYLRRIKNVSLTIPSVLGPMTGVHCRLTLLSSETRIEPRLSGPMGVCCEKPPAPPSLDDCCGCGCDEHRHGHHHGHHHGHDYAMVLPGQDDAASASYLPIKDDPRFVKLYGAKEAIATSTAQDDTGLFELSFRDERYLPFEFHGAISRWRLELPPENNAFDLSTTTDAVLQLRYTAREGGEVLRRAAMAATRRRLPDAGLRIVDVRQELPAVWHRLQLPPPHEERRAFELEVVRDWFPFLPGKPAVYVTRLELFLEVSSPEHCDCDTPRPKDCGRSKHHSGEACGELPDLPQARYTLELLLPTRQGHSHDQGCDSALRALHAVASKEWPAVYHGALAVSLGPITSQCDGLVVKVELPRSMPSLASLFVVLHYEMEHVPVHHQGLTHGGA